MLKYGNKEIRNLQEQVLKNMDDISDIKSGTMVLDEFGIKVIDQVATQAEFEEKWDIESEEFAELEYGDAVAVGTAAPYKLHIKTRANDSHPADYWFYIGQFPEPGPQGEKGDTGAKGDTGNTGSQGPQGERGYGITSVVVVQDEDAGDYILYEMTFTYGDGHTTQAYFKAYKGEDGEDGINKVNGVSPTAAHPKEVIIGPTDIQVQDLYPQTLNLKQVLSDLKTNKQNKLTAGTNITIVDDVISASGGSGGKEYYAGNGIALEGDDDDTITVLADSDEFKFGETDGELLINEISADKVIATNTQSVQDNLERIDEEIEGVIDDVNDIKEDYITSSDLSTALEDKQDVLTAGTNITIIDNVISASGGSELTPEALAEVLEGSATVVVDLNQEEDKLQVSLDQDVIDEIDGKQDAISDLATIRSGAALGATALQSVPNTYRTAADQDVIDAGKASIDSLADVAFSGDYEDLSNTPTIPTATSDLTNDSGFITNSYHDNTKQDTLTAGTNITIENNVISAASGTTYTAGNGINITNNAISVDDNYEHTQLKVDNYTFNENNDGELLLSRGATDAELTVWRINNDILYTDAIYVGSDGTLSLGGGATIDSGNTSLNIGNTSGTIAVTSEIPTATSDLTNDSGFITAADIPTPTNMVTTDTAQTITGKKTFREFETSLAFDGAKFVIDRGSSFSINSSIGTKLNSANYYKQCVNFENTDGIRVESNIANSGHVNAGIKIDLSGNMVPIGSASQKNIGTSNDKWNTVYATNLSDGTTTKTMTEVLAGGTPSNMVTTNTTQTITGTKTFSGGLLASSAQASESVSAPILKVYTNPTTHSGNYIQFDSDVTDSQGHAFNKKLGIGAVTSADRTIELPNKNGTIALTSDIPSTSNFVTTNTAQTINGTKTFNTGNTYGDIAVDKIRTSSWDDLQLTLGDDESSSKCGLILDQMYSDNHHYTKIMPSSTVTTKLNATTLTLPATTGTLALTSQYTYQTTAPTSAITDGGIHIVYLQSEPATKYNGYIYLIKE